MVPGSSMKNLIWIMCLLTFVVVLVDKNSIQFSFSMHVTLNLCTQVCGTHFEIHWNKIYHLMILQLFTPKDNNKKNHHNTDKF